MSEVATVRRIRGALLEPAGNFHLCGLISLGAALLLLVEVSLLPSKGSFVLAAVPTAVVAPQRAAAMARTPVPAPTSSTFLNDLRFSRRS